MLACLNSVSQQKQHLCPSYIYSPTLIKSLARLMLFELIDSHVYLISGPQAAASAAAFQASQFDNNQNKYRKKQGQVPAA